MNTLQYVVRGTVLTLAGMISMVLMAASIFMLEPSAKLVVPPGCPPAVAMVALSFFGSLAAFVWTITALKRLTKNP